MPFINSGIVASFQSVYPLLINAGSRLMLANSFPSDTALIQYTSNKMLNRWLHHSAAKGISRITPRGRSRISEEGVLAGTYT